MIVCTTVRASLVPDAEEKWQPGSSFSKLEKTNSFAKKIMMIVQKSEHSQVLFRHFSLAFLKQCLFKGEGLREPELASVYFIQQTIFSLNKIFAGPGPPTPPTSPPLDGPVIGHLCT